MTASANGEIVITVIGGRITATRIAVADLVAQRELQELLARLLRVEGDRDDAPVVRAKH